MGNLQNVLLTPAALFYGTGISIRNKLFDTGIFQSHKAAVPVVSIGNITMGGTGKTPLVDFVIKYYSRKGLKTAILSRGYKRNTKGVGLVSDGSRVHLDSREAGDECAMLAHKNPGTIVVVAEKRKEGAGFIADHFAENLPDVIVLDDGFQHRQLYRDLDIVVIDSTAPFFEDRLIPAGRLREPCKNLDRADLLILSRITGTEQALRFEKKLRAAGKPLVKTGIRPGKPVQFAGSDVLQPERVIALAGIGQPERFLESLQQSGMEVVFETFFGDHADFPIKKMNSVVQQAQLNDLSIITTEKDYHRLLSNRPTLEALSQAPCFYLPIEIDIIEGKELLEEMLDNVVIP